jgi:hypothetical protein
MQIGHKVIIPTGIHRFVLPAGSRTTCQPSGVSRNLATGHWASHIHAISVGLHIRYMDVSVYLPKISPQPKKAEWGVDIFNLCAQCEPSHTHLKKKLLRIRNVRKQIEMFFSLDHSINIVVRILVSGGHGMIIALPKIHGVWSRAETLPRRKHDIQT